MRQIQAASQKRRHLPADPLGALTNPITNIDRARWTITVLNTFPPLAKKKSPHVSVAIQDYLADANHRGVSPSSLNQRAHCFRLLLLATKDARVEKLKAKHIKKFWKVFDYWPKHAGLRKDLQGMTDKQILAVGKKEGAKTPSVISVELAKRILQSFFNWLVGRRVILVSPF